MSTDSCAQIATSVERRLRESATGRESTISRRAWIELLVRTVDTPSHRRSPIMSRRAGADGCREIHARRRAAATAPG